MPGKEDSAMPERVRLGSQLFINKDDTEADIRRLVRSMKEHKLELIRLFMFWDHLEPRPGEWRYVLYDACFDEAARQGLSVVPTLMSVSPPGWMRLTDGPQSVANLDDPDFLPLARTYIRNVVLRYKDHPHLDSWILWNEASRRITRNAHSQRAYVAYLQQKYGDIEQVNRLSYHQYERFEDLLAVATDGDSYSQPFKAFGEQLAWKRFAVHNLMAQLRFIRDEIRRWDDRHPIHVNPHNLAGDMHEAGQSIWQEREIVDFLGCSAHPMWHSVRFPEGRLGQSVAYFADLMRSSTPDPDRKFWVTELQGGATLYSAVRPMTPSRAELGLWMWESIGAGAKAIVFWCFNARTGGYEGGEWSLLNQLEQTSPRLSAVLEVAERLERHRPVYEAAMPPRPRILLLYSEASWLLGTVEAGGQSREAANPRNPNMYADALAGAYLMCSDLSLEVDFVNERLLLDGDRLARASALILPGAVALSAELLAVITRFAAQGGTVIADGLTGWKDAEGRLNRDVQQRTAALFGAAIEDIVTTSEDLTFPSDFGIWEGWFYRLPLQLQGGEAIGAFADGTTAIVRHAVGQGRAIRIGTSLFQRYFADPHQGNLAALKSLLAEVIDGEPCALLNGGAGLRLRRLDHPGGFVLVLLNYSHEPQRALLRFRSAGALHRLDAEDAASADIPAGGRQAIDVPPQAAVQLRFETALTRD